MDQTPPTIRIFRPGTFTSNEGTVVSLSDADLAATAAAYDPSADPAPLVIGHPALDDPAYGWVKGLTVDGGELVAVPDRVEPAFAEAVREGRYAKVSARFYPPAHPGNPKPGTWYLKHVGFLGAHAPGVKGLGTVSFAEGGDAGTITIDFTKPEEKSVKEQTDLASFAAREVELARREEVLKAGEKAIADKAKADAHASNVSFAEGLVKAVTLAPKGKALVVGLLDHLDATAVVSFGEAGDLTPNTALRQLLEGGEPLVSLGEFGAKPKEDAKVFASFAAPAGYEVSEAQADLYARAKAIQAENPDLEWMAAVRRAQG
ncbi:hypothetical protein [Sphingobium aquiterrae]|uniref:hypothetical protein n=1 Tax=Sphingobium aquiterrae TaxID=2038656 RepID=UPI003015DCF3